MTKLDVNLTNIQIKSGLDLAKAIEDKIDTMSSDELAKLYAKLTGHEVLGIDKDTDEFTVREN